MQSPNNHIIYRCPSCSSRVSSNDAHCSVCGFELTPTSGDVVSKTREPASSFRAAETVVPPSKTRDPAPAAGPSPPIPKPRESQAAAKPKETPKTPWVRREIKSNTQRLPWGVIGVSAMIVSLMLGALALIRSASAPNPLITPVITFATGQAGSAANAVGTSAPSSATKPVSAFVVQATETVRPPTAVPTVPPTAVPTIAPTAAPTAVPAPTTQVTTTTQQSQTQTVTSTIAVQPVAAPAAPTGPTIIDYIVQPNDTCTGIAERYRSSVSALYQYNTLNESCLIIIGARLKVPFNSRFPGAPVNIADAPALTQLYVAQPNDTCESIATRFRIPLSNLLKANNLNENCLIVTGSRLQVPIGTGVVEDPKATAVTQQLRASYTVPTAASPADRAVLVGLQDGVTMQWQNLGSLRPDEWYVITVQPIDGVNALVYETKTSSLRIADPAILENTNERTFIWVVQVKRVTATRSTGERVYENISPPSEPRRVTWRR